MKTLLFTILSAFSMVAFAQKTITVDVIPQPAGNNAQTVFSTDIPQANLKDVKKDWMKYISKDSKGNPKEENGEYIQYRAAYKNISPRPFDVYSKLTETSEGVRLTAWFTQNGRVFLSKESYSSDNMAVQKYLRDFAVEQYRNAVQSELKMEQDKLSTLEKEFASSVNDEEKSIKTMNENDRSTEKAYSDIATNNSDIQNSSYKINDQKEMVANTASDPNANKGAKKTLHELENEKKDLQKENDSKNKDIDSRDKENREEERKNMDAQQQQHFKMSALETQKLKVNEVQNKLANIK